jgi:hypothetical protein
MNRYGLPISSLQRLLKKRRLHWSSLKWAKTKLIEIGKFEATKDLGQYDIGQFFIHRMFGYRGVVLFRWLANVYDRDTTNLTTTVDDK